MNKDNNKAGKRNGHHLKAEMPAPKNEPANIVSIKSEPQQIDKQQKAGKEIPEWFCGSLKKDQ